MIAVFLMILLPLLEIAAFIVIGGKIGVGWSLLWVVAATVAGFYFLATMGAQTLKKARKSVDADIYPFEEMFDGICIMTGALLLVFPGFVTDLLALPLLFAPARGAVFRFLKYQHESLLRDISRGAQGFTCWYYEERKDGGRGTIEGEFRRLDGDSDKSPPPAP